jgi:hypothetical protein
MATPHLGVTKESLLFAQPGRHNGPSQFILGLLDDSETLEEITDQFVPLMKNFSVYNFWEQLEANFGRAKALIVEKTSAAPPTWRDVGKCGVYATYSDIAKFSNTDSPGYILVLAALDQKIYQIPLTRYTSGGRTRQSTCNRIADTNCRVSG